VLKRISKLTVASRLKQSPEAGFHRQRFSAQYFVSSCELFKLPSVRNLCWSTVNMAAGIVR
jgi:hypothetical protein